MHQEHKILQLTNKLNNLSPGLVVSYDLWSGNGAGTYTQRKRQV